MLFTRALFLFLFFLVFSNISIFGGLFEKFFLATDFENFSMLYGTVFDYDPAPSAQHFMQQATN